MSKFMSVINFVSAGGSASSNVFFYRSECTLSARIFNPLHNDLHS